MDTVVATATRGCDTTVWELRSFGAIAESTMRPYRQAWPKLRVRLFTDEEWDALPYGQRSDDWVSVGGQSYWRYPDGVRPV